jgi:hypothetical protein
MRKLTMTLTAAMLVLGPMATTASAQTQWLGAKSLYAQLKERDADCQTGELCRKNRSLWLWRGLGQCVQ